MQWRKWLAAVLAASLAVGLITAAALAQTLPDLQSEAIAALKAFAIVEGDAGTGDVRPGDQITRAELMKILTVAAGLTAAADELMNQKPFSDVEPNLWYTGFITVARERQWSTGYPDGSFQPGDAVTYGEVITFLARLVGLEPTAGISWPDSYIDAARRASVIPHGLEVSGQAGEPAIRGHVFILAHNAFLRVKDGSGKSLYQRQFDSTPPRISLNPLAATTTAAQAEVSGQVTDAVTATLNGQTLALGSDGRFSARVDLAVGNNTITVTATDMAGNDATATAAVARGTGAPDQVSAPTTLEVAAGDSVSVEVTVRDSSGAIIPNPELAASVEPATLGSFDPAAGIFTAGTRAGTGSLTLMAGAASPTVQVTVTPGPLARLEISPQSASVAKGDLVTFTVRGLDQYGNEATAVTPAFTVDKEGGFVNLAGQFVGSAPGVYTVTATAGSLSASATVGIYGDVAEIRLDGPASVVGNLESEARFTAVALDEFGNVITGLSKPAALDVAVDPGLVMAATGTAAAAIDIVNGQASFGVLGAGSAAGLLGKVQATYTDAAGSFSAERELEVVAPVATAIQVKQQDRYLPANDNSGTATVAFVVVDQDGVRMADGIDYSLDLTLDSGAPATLAGAMATYRDGTPAVAELRSIAAETGTITVTAAAPGLTSASASIIAAIAGNPAQVILTPAGDGTIRVDELEPNWFQLTIADRNGIPVPAQLKGTLSASRDVTFWDAGAPLATGREAAFNLGATPVFSARFGIASTRAEATTVQVQVEWTAGATGMVVSNPITLTHLPGEASSVGFTRRSDQDLWLSLTSPAATLTVQAFDQFGNPTPQSGVRATIKAPADGEEITVNGKAAGAGGVEVKTGADGTAAVQVTTQPLPKDYALDLMPHGTMTVAPDRQRVNLHITDRLPTSVAAAIVALDGAAEAARASVTAGDWVRFKVQVKDQFGEVMKSPDLSPFLSIALAEAYGNHSISLDGDGEFGTREDELDAWMGWNVHPASGTYYFDARVAKAARLTLTAELDATATPITGAGAITVRPGEAAMVTVRENDARGIVTVREGQPTAITLQVADGFGNPIANSPTGWTAWIHSYSDPAQIEARLSAGGATLQAGAVTAGAEVTPNEPFDLRGSRQIYLVGRTADDPDTNGALETIEIRGYFDANGNGQADVGSESTLVGLIHVDIDK